MSGYRAALTEAMFRLGQRDDTVFMGQAVAYPGTGMSGTFARVPAAKLLELPVAEDMQMGMATGMALDGLLPICVYPRWNFLLLAASQLVLHLDKMHALGFERCPVLIRTAVATPIPLHPGPQHLGDFSDAFESMLECVRIERLRAAADIVPTYLDAAKRPFATILVEYTELYDG